MEEIRRALSSLAGVREVSVSESIGTVTVHYDPHRHEELKKHFTTAQSSQPITLTAVPKLSDLSHIDEMLEKETEFLSRHSHVAHVFFQFINQLDMGVKRATGNAVDLKVIAPLALAAGVFLELGIAASTPVWLTLGLFSFNHFIDMHSHPADGDAQVQAERPPARRKPVRFP